MFVTLNAANSISKPFFKLAINEIVFTKDYLPFTVFLLHPVWVICAYDWPELYLFRC